MNVENKCISTKIVENTRDVYSASKIVEIFMGSDTDDTIDRLFDTLFDTKIFWYTFWYKDFRKQ